MSDNVAPEATGDEDIPSDFFDDFNKDDFMEGLSVIDSWDDDDRKRRNAKDLDQVEDLRELIGGKEDEKPVTAPQNKYKWTRDSGQERQSDDTSRRLDDYIKPGSRRDPNKTNEAIKKDKQDKVMEHLTKTLESGDSLRPPGTELDDFFDESKSKEKLAATLNVKQPVKVKEISPQHDRERVKHSPRPRRHSPRHHSPHRSAHPARRSPRRSPGMSPRRHAYGQERRRYSPDRRNRRIPSPVQHRRRSPLHYRRSPISRRSPNRRSPIPRRASPRHLRRSRSRSPYRKARRSRTRSPKLDSFLYPQDSQHLVYDSVMPSLIPHPSNYPEPAAVYPYSAATIPGPAYVGGYQPPYEYAAAPLPPVTPVPQPVPAPVVVNPPNPVHFPSMVPAPTQMISPIPQQTVTQQKAPFDALAQLVADGKISREDYLKLAPNKNAISPMDTKTRVMVVNRCQIAMSKLGQYQLQNRLVLNSNMLNQDATKSIASKFCSPLKRQAVIEFEFTKDTPESNDVNKQILNTIINTIGLEKVITRPKTRNPRNMKDAATQTTKPACDVCSIKEATQCYDVMTSVDPEHFSSSIHTQVIEEDLYNSKSLFNPTGSMADGATMSIAHMTPAQLVSQLAARAKTLKQSDPPLPQPPANQYMRRPNYNYDGRGRDQQYQNNYGNYRY